MPWWLLGAMAVLALGGAGLGVTALLMRAPRAAPAVLSDAPAAPPSRPPLSGTLATPIESIAPVDRTMVLALRPLLHVTRGPAAGRLFDVNLQQATLIGRAPGNDVVLPDLAVSSQHCRIRPAEEGGFELLDLGSTNGTFVNEKRVDRHRLAPGDTLKLGESQIQFRLDHSREA
jgi:hypothetical protein